MEVLLLVLMGAAVVVALIVYTDLCWGFVCFKFWYWFLLPVFPALPRVDFWQCVGLYLFISLFHNHIQVSIKKEYKDESAAWMVFVMPWLVLLFGWILKLIIE